MPDLIPALPCLVLLVHVLKYKNVEFIIVGIEKFRLCFSKVEIISVMLGIGLSGVRVKARVTIRGIGLGFG